MYRLFQFGGRFLREPGLTVRGESGSQIKKLDIGRHGSGFEGIRQLSLQPLPVVLFRLGSRHQTAVLGVFGRFSPGAFFELVLQFRVLKFEPSALNAVRYDLNRFRRLRELVGRIPVKARGRGRRVPLAHRASSGNAGRPARKFGFAVLLYGSDGALWNAVVSARSSGALDQPFRAPAQCFSLADAQQTARLSG